MKKICIFLLLVFFVAACATSAPITPVATGVLLPTLTPTPKSTPTATITLIPGVTPSPTSDYPGEGYGPSSFPANIDPLTGLKVDNPSVLDRRPMIVKVANLPREYRPQWGLSKADQVFEYYIEEGTTRFAAVFLGQDAKMVGPIRSGRFFDNHLINMYKANFAFGSADYRVRDLLYNQNYADRLVIESYCPPMCRFEPNGVNYLMTNTVDLTTYINQRNVSGGNKRQDLDGFLFRYQTPENGLPADHLFLRYSAAIYNRWDYDPETGKYFRFSDAQNDFENGQNEVYQQLTDRLTGGPISADNVVVMYVPHSYYLRKPEIVDIVASGPGKAYLFRDGKAFALKWYRNGLEQLFILVDKDGKNFPLKPGNTWFEVVGTSTGLENQNPDWRFTFQIP